MAELVRLKVDVIVTGPTGARCKKATSTTPIVMTYSADPVRARLVASLAHPGGSVTGLSDYHGVLGAKRLEFFKEVVPLASRVAVVAEAGSYLGEMSTLLSEPRTSTVRTTKESKFIVVGPG